MLDWGSALIGMKQVPEESVLEALFHKHIERHPGLREHMAYYSRLPEGHTEKCYEYLYKLVRRHVDQQRRA